jgi:transcriptional regulator with XRE-family HTH domain
MDESRREALGRFLRARREALTPEKAGIASRRGRRTPGLRREEVAFLADIGVKWYARLESGDEIHPSPATLNGIASALQLSNAELEYMLELAGLWQSGTFADIMNSTILEQLQVMVTSVRGVGATVADRVLTPLFWNAISEGMYSHSRFSLPEERNALVRSLLDPEMIGFLGSDRDEIVMRAAGMLRLNQSSQSPSPFAGAVYEKVKDEPLFQLAWNRRTIASDEPQRDLLIRNHAQAGRLVMHAITFSMPMRSDLILRVMIPADEDTREKFDQFERIELRQRRPAGPRLKVCT